jgi:hypothetical protein
MSKIDTSNPDKLTWAELPREMKKEMLMCEVEGLEVQAWLGGMWRESSNVCAPDDIIRIKPKEVRETVKAHVWIKNQPHAIAVETVNGEIDKSVQPRWAEWNQSATR